ncbi:ubiquinone/menaquinone biosynthesis C-methylase UbiE [Amycolatopsis bartoniae]|uniref:Methyltransferase n=1 Tax=Amycolatopsis bartoniae TaxID=941986 RepID=A0A8H9MBG2_9PSEU|nr:class I SAM-dependent methyltransferase [Amycolatopsis bartoniae]MBB2935327.1 ubiquinone/menaquinone biosynthesis C-methylase UbiE [Amycolatopsis bartoniae]TVT06772.1 class I SAM-dependent methyltransferase [Amycolatopsis bartoniae]GHF56023.1 methyltransferase [Amycolatopsis bartoniae]
MTEPSFVTETRAAYDTVAADYAELLRDLLADSTFDRAMLGAFAELVRGGVVAELGCGPGRITGHLASLGLDVFGVDLSPQMVAVARRAHPELRFEEGSMLALDLPDASVHGIVAWYSIIHTPPEQLPTVFAEFARVLVPGGRVLLAFQVGDDHRHHIEHAYGHDISADAYRLSPDNVSKRLAEAGLSETARLVREPEGQWENTPQAYLLARA